MSTETTDEALEVRVLEEAKRHAGRRGIRDAETALILATLRGLLEARVVVPGPAVTEGIEEAG